MTGDGNRPRGLLRSVAVILLLFSLAPSLNCFSVRGLIKSAHQDTSDGEAAVTEGRIGHIVFGKANIPSWSSSEGNGGLAHVDSPQADDPETLGQTWQQENPQEAAWRRLNPSLACGATRMKLKAMGPGAANLQLDMGQFNGVARSLPLTHVPRSCGYTMRENAFGLVLVVPYDGCGVTQENGNYVLPMSWLQNPVKLACPTSQSADSTLPPTTAATTTPAPTTVSPPAVNPPAYPGYPDFPYGPLYSQFQWLQQWPYMGPWANAALTAPPPTTTEPVTTPATTVPPTMNPVVNPNYPPFSYLSLYPPFPWPQPIVAPATSPDSTTAAQTTTEPPTTTAPPTVNPPVIDQYPYYQYPYYWFGSPSNLAAETTTVPPTTPAPSTGMPTQPSSPLNYPNYLYYPARVPGQHGLYYPFIQPQYPQSLSPSTDCSMQGAASASCPNKTPGSSYFGWSSSYPYSRYPFFQYTWQKNEQLPSSWKYRSPAGYLPGIHTLVQPYPGFLYQQPMPWFSNSGQQMSQGV